MPAAPAAARWTHFVAVRLAHCSEALEAARSLQRSISGTCAATRLAATAAEKLHVTLAVVRPNDEEQTRRVARILQDLDAAWRPEVSRTLWVRDLGFFPGGRVCFLRPDDEGQWLHALAADVRAALLHEGIAFDPRPFAPHATIFKMSKVPRRRRGYKEAARFFRIMAGQDPDEASKSGSAEDDSGAELDSAAVSLRERLLHPEASWRPKQKTTATSLELCSMLDRPAPDGFYVVCVPGDENAVSHSLDCQRAQTHVHNSSSDVEKTANDASSLGAPTKKPAPAENIVQSPKEREEEDR